jgi:hypothetical protein
MIITEHEVSSISKSIIQSFHFYHDFKVKNVITNGLSPAGEMLTVTLG